MTTEVTKTIVISLGDDKDEILETLSEFSNVLFYNDITWKIERYFWANLSFGFIVIVSLNGYPEDIDSFLNNNDFDIMDANNLDE